MISSLLVESALRSVLLALVVWVGLQIFRVRNVLAQKAAWGIVLVAALAMPMVLPMAYRIPATLVIPAGTFRAVAAIWPTKPATKQVPTASQPASTVSLTPVFDVKPIADSHSVGRFKSERANETQFSPAGRTSLPAGGFAAPAISPTRVDSIPAAQYEASSAPDRLSPIQAAGLLYLAIAAVLFIRLLYGLTVAIDIWQSAKPVLLDPSPLTDGVCVRSSDAVSMPVTIGSAVVLPADYRDWDAEKLRIVIAHERSHIRQGDFYLQLLAGFYASLVWFSPLGWWLKRKLSDLAEAISDRAGLEEAANRSSYAQILLEFAAAPRPTPIGVAMARSGSLSRRIERLLNDASFRQAFAGTRRTLVAVIFVPAVLFAATALVRVEAAGQAPAPPAPPADVATPGGPVAPAPATGVSRPEPISGEPASLPDTEVVAPPAHPGIPAPAAGPSEPSTPAIALPAPPAGPTVMTLVPLPPSRGKMMIIPAAPVAPGTRSLMVLTPPGAPAPSMAIIAPRTSFGVGHGFGAGQSTTTERGSSSFSEDGKHSGYHYSYSSNGESYAVVHGGEKGQTSFSGNIHADEVEKARKQAHGDFLWFLHDGKSYFVDDPAILAEIDAMYKPMEELGRQQEVLGKKQEALGKQQEDLGKQQEAVSVPTPDMNKEIARLEEAIAKLKASQGKNMSEDQFADLQGKLGELQARIGEMQGQIGSKQGEFGARMGELGEKMGELGEQQGRLGEEQGKIAMGADRKIKAIIDQSLQNGKAHPVQ